MVVEITEEQFKEEALAFLQANAKPAAKVHYEWGRGSDRVALFADKSREEELAEAEEAKAWARLAFDAGFGWITGPKQYGGRELPPSYQRLYDSLAADFDIPSQAPRGIGLGMVAPTILAHGTEVAKTRYLRALYRGDIIACQLFSEPSAGSDLASLQTKAVRDGDEWVVTGQKVWTSGAHYSDIGEIICRSDPDVEKHRGLTGFIVDMHAPGVEVRPLRQMTGGASFNEVFFDEVRIPDDHRLGEVNGGWTVALTTLMNERAAIGVGGAGVQVAALEMVRLMELARHMGKDDDPMVRQRLADLYISTKIADITNLRALAKLNAGQLPGPELSISKLALTNNLQKVVEFVSLVLGSRLVADTGEWGTYAWSEFVLGVPGLRVAGGTDEVLKNVIGERVLGLPKEPS
ncbi:MAG: acyl-CoA dehydrogenase family protein [Actinobacteria bacterium]|jgi:acyl-CoA dehydrogenase|nr:acyl-CoA dehydrogenase family protein [Actinomycetota bacterium]MCL6094917.1 acyl-CoA dehydrogenase family protein [Actinomycetota bacterium]